MWSVDYPTSSPAEFYSYYFANCLIRTKIKEKEAGDGLIKKDMRPQTEFTSRCQLSTERQISAVFN